MSQSRQLTLKLPSSPDDPLDLALRRACDRCRRRKSRCDGRQSCRTCLKAQAPCLYLEVPKPLGRRPRSNRNTASLKNNSSIRALNRPEKCTPDDVPSYGTPSNASEQSVESTTPYSSIDIESHKLGSQDTLCSTSEPAEWQDSVCCLQTPQDFTFSGLSPCAPLIEDTLPRDHSWISTPPSCSGPRSTDGFELLQGSSNPGMVESWMASISSLVPYVDIFFERMYPVLPVLDQDLLPTEATASDPSHSTWSQYALLTSLAAAVSAQLNLSGKPTDKGQEAQWDEDVFASSDIAGEVCLADFWIQHTLRARQCSDFMSEPDESNIMTSFFLFYYYGNKNNSQKAWYYLREAIGFALAIGLDDQDTYRELDAKTSQRRCRLFWLLFVTERAYALQRKSSAILRSSIELPRIFDSDNPQLIYGFVGLVNLFKSVDDRFLSLWKGGKPVGAKPQDNHQSSWQHTFSTVLAEQNINCVSEIMEVQRLDIMVTQQWLHLLAWQLQSRQVPESHALTRGQLDTEVGTATHRKVPLVASRNTLQIITKADKRALEAHGIGMEQKIFDIACCLTDVLSSSRNLEPHVIARSHDYLHGFMTILSSFRNRESEYLQPLLSKASQTLAAELSVPPPLPAQKRYDGFFQSWGNSQSQQGIDFDAHDGFDGEVVS